jgi:hypothetical protein
VGGRVQLRSGLEKYENGKAQEITERKKKDAAPCL